MSRTRHPHVNAHSKRRPGPKIVGTSVPNARLKRQPARILSRTRAVWFRDRLRLTHQPFASRTHGSGWHTHSHGPPSVMARFQHHGQYRGRSLPVSTNKVNRAALFFVPSPQVSKSLSPCLTRPPSKHMPPPGGARCAPARGKQTGAPFPSNQPAGCKTRESPERSPRRLRPQDSCCADGCD